MIARDAAWWAGSSAIAAWMLGCATLLMNGGGLFFIWRQLRATETAAHAAKVASEIALMSERPWMAISLDEPEATVRKRGQELLLLLSVRFTNVGRTPAMFTTTFASLAEDDSSEAADQIVKEMANRPMPFGRTIFPGREIQDRFAIRLEPQNASPWSIVVGCHYGIHGDTRHRTTVECLMVSKAQGFAPSDRMYPDTAVAWKARLVSDHFIRVDPT